MAIRLEHSVTAKCRPEHVWEKFRKLEEWSWWNACIGQTKWLEGEPWKKGSRFHLEFVRPRNLKVQPVVLEVEAPAKVAWVGKAKGVTGEHWFSFELQPDGATTVLKTWEDFSGPGTFFLGSGMKKDIVKMYADWLDALKIEAEKVAREQHARS